MDISITPAEYFVVDNTSLRISIATNLIVFFPTGDTFNYTYTYTLVYGEPYLRIQLNGTAPSYSTIFTSFQYPQQITGYEHGTPTHWDFKTPYPFGLQNDFMVTMEAVHDFIIPEYNGIPLGAIYHTATPAWGVLDDTLYGAVLRNSPGSCGSKGASGSDSSQHNIHYAVRVSSGLQAPDSGQPHQEARLYQTPPRAVYIDQLTNTSASFSLLSMVSPTSSLVTAVKMGSKDPSQLFIRVYNPSNIPVIVEFDMDENYPIIDVIPVSALETEIPFQGGKVFKRVGQYVNYVSLNALSTVWLKRIHRN